MYWFDNLALDSFVLRLVSAILFMLFFLIFRKLLRKLTLKLLSKIKFRKYDLSTKLTEALQKPLDYLFLFTGCFGSLCLSPFVKYTHITAESLWIVKSPVPLDFIPFEWVTKGYIVIFIIFCTWAIYNLEYLYEAMVTGLNDKLSITDNTLLIRFTCKLIRFFTLVLGGGIILSFVFGDISSLVTGVGLGGVAFAFISKDALSNILSGALLMLDKPFVIGDWVQVLDSEGIIEDISFRSTRIRTFTQGIVIIPNAKIGGENIINWSRMTKRRVKFNLHLAYDTPTAQINRCMEHIKEALLLNESIEKNTFLVALESIQDYCLDIQIIFFSLKTDYASYINLKEIVNLKLLEICEKEAIRFAFPTQTVYVQTLNGGEKPEL